MKHTQSIIQRLKNVIITIKYHTGLGKHRCDRGNGLSYCEHCKKYMRQYQIDLKLRIDKDYQNVQPINLLDLQNDTIYPCIYCHRTEGVEFVSENIGADRLEMLDYLSYAPKLSYVEYDAFEKMINTMDQANTDDKNNVHFLEHNQYLPEKTADDKEN